MTNLVGASYATFTIALGAPAPTTLYIPWATKDGTAKAGSDYAGTTGTLVIPAGLSSGEINVLVFGRAAGDTAERVFYVELSPPPNLELTETELPCTIKPTVNAVTNLPVEAWVSGVGAPTDMVGVNGQMYLDTVTGDTYGPKSNDAWPGVPSANIKGPKGDAGSTGPAGPAGPKGDTGATGPAGQKGSTGDPGPAGPKGDTGDTGPAGPKGDTGAQGPKGDTGPSGGKWWSGAGVPSAGDGGDGDMFLNSASGDIYGPKTSGAWGSPVMTITGGGGGSGAGWRVGSGVPAAGLGSDGDMYLDSATGDVYGPKAAGSWGAASANIKGATGAKGDTGSTGAAGANGNTVLNGTIAPTAGVGANGDFYLNTATNTMYGPKAAGVWPGSGVSLVGPAGANGTNGTNGTNGATWYSGSGAPSAGTGANGDFYLNTANGDVYKKASGAWGSPICNLTGPAGSGGGGGGTTIYASVMHADVALNASSFTNLSMTTATPPVTGMLYAIKGALLTQADTAATLAIQTYNEGATTFRMSARSADSGGALKLTTTNQDSVSLSAGVGSVQDGMVEIDGVALFSYVAPTGPDLKIKLATGSWCNILKGSYLTFTPLGVASF